MCKNRRFKTELQRQKQCQPAQNNLQNRLKDNYIKNYLVHDFKQCNRVRQHNLSKKSLTSAKSIEKYIHASKAEIKTIIRFEKSLLPTKILQKRENRSIIFKNFLCMTTNTLLSVALVVVNAFILLNTATATSLFDNDFDEAVRKARNRMNKHGGRTADSDQLYYYGNENNHNAAGIHSAQQQQMPLVHTFGTHESCARICPRTCVAQELEDLAMMQRWICTPGTDPPGVLINGYAGKSANVIYPDQSIRTPTGSSVEFFQFGSQFLLIIVPFGLLSIIFILIIWCRKCSQASI